MNSTPRGRPVLGIVGPCAAGKSTLIAQLAPLGLTAKHIAQEHSFVPTMWARLSSPDILIFLDVSFDESMRRRKQNWGLEDYHEQHRRLAHARQHAHLYLDTTDMDPQMVLERVLEYLEQISKEPI